jgi:hypothetical protein
VQSKIQEHREEFKAYVKEYNVVMKTAKSDYIRHIESSSNNTPEVLWKLVHTGRGSLNNTLPFNIIIIIITTSTIALC